MSPHKTLPGIRQLVRDKQYSLALTEISRVHLTSKRDEAELLVLRTKALIGVGCFELAYIDRAADLLRSLTDSRLLAEAKYLRASILIVKGQLTDALEELAEAYVYFKRIDDVPSMGMTSRRQAYVSFQQADYRSSLAFLARAECHYRAAENDAELGLVQLARSLTHWRSGDLRKALLELQEIHTSGLTSRFSESNRANYYHTLAMVYGQLGDFQPARRALQHTAGLSSELRRERFHRLEAGAALALASDRLAEAIEHLRSAERLAAEIAPDSTLVSQIKRLCGDWQLAAGVIGAAEDCAQEALAVASRLNEKVEIAACWRVFAQVETHRKNDKAAREWYRKALDMFNLISSRYELAVTRFLAATSGLFDNGERTAYLYLAKEYFEAEEVAPYIEKVNDALKSSSTQPVSIGAVTLSRDHKRVLVAASPMMTSRVETARNVARTGMTILLTGETGAGKDHLASFIHEWSERPGQFVSVNAATVPDSVAETLLFGVRKGAYTGADQDRAGLFEEAHQGTLYLNEVADTSMEFQAKLLEVLDGRPIRRLGESQTREVDYRLIAATNHDLKDRIAKGLFRADLYYRLHQICIELPPLRERREEVPLLTRQFLRELGYAGEDETAIDEFIRIVSSCTWPGNVRELRHTVGRFWMTGRGDLAAMTRLAADELIQMDDCELATVLAECNGNRREAARRLGVSEGTVRYRLRKLGD